MNTMFVRRWPSRREPARRVAGLVDDLGRPRGRARTRARPVAQNGQPTAQPAWLEMHSVCRSREPAAGRVVHQDRLDERAVGEAVERLLGLAAVAEPDLGVVDRVEAERAASAVAERRRQRPDLAASVTPPSATRRRRSGGTRYDGSPCAATQAARSSGVRPEMPGTGVAGHRPDATADDRRPTRTEGIPRPCASRPAGWTSSSREPLPVAGPEAALVERRHGRRAGPGRRARPARR